VADGDPGDAGRLGAAPLRCAAQSDGGAPTDLAIAQVRSVVQAAVPDAPRPVVVLDSHYDLPQLVQAQLAVD
jgi:hypothetical protein